MGNMVDSYKEEVKSLIKTGEFELQLISFEYGIPMDIILNWKTELERENQSFDRKDNNKVDKAVYIKANEIKDRYMALYDNANKTRKSQKKDKPYYSELSEEQKDKIRDALLTMKSWINRVEDNSSFKDKIAIVKKIVMETLKLDKNSRLLLPIDIVEGYIELLFSKEVENIMKQYKYDELICEIKRAKNILVRYFARTIEYEVEGTNNIDLLRELYSKIRPDLLKVSMLLDTTKMKIDNKIRTIQQNNLINNLNCNISPELESIIIALTEGRLDIDEANALLDKEAKKRNEKRPKNNKFASITEEQDRRQILIQIKTLIREQGEKYTIKNVDLSISQIMRLCNIPIEQAVDIVVEQQIKLKQFEEARETCSRYGKLSGEAVTSTNLLLKKISSAEKTDIILRGLRDVASPEEEEKFLKIIEEELVMEKATRTLRLGKLDLGMNKEGTKKITFGDVWSDERLR